MDQIYSGKTSKRNKRKKKTEIEACFTGTKKQLEEKVMESLYEQVKDRCGSNSNFSYDTPSDNSNVFESGQENSDHKR